MKDETNEIETIESEEEDFYTDDDIFSFNSWGADLSFRELIERYTNEELVKPELQRNYVWDKASASRFIDSILLGLPIPSIFLAKQSDEKLLIIDGYQRIMTVFDYVRGIFSVDNKVFKLSNSDKINERWRGKAFSELSETEQRKIKNTTIHSIIFVQAKPSDNDTGLYQIFERINTSGKTLMPQEIRNCIYQGKLNSLLLKLNKDETWRSLFGGKEEDSRMRDVEFILRYLFIRNTNFKEMNKSAISLKLELNLFMKDKKNSENEALSKFEKDFLSTTKKAHALFNKNAFHNVSKEKTDQLSEKFNPTIFDSIMTVLSEVEIPEEVNQADFEAKRKLLLQDSDYQKSTSIRTTNIESINKRIDLAKKYLFGDHE